MQLCTIQSRFSHACLIVCLFILKLYELKLLIQCGNNYFESKEHCVSSLGIF